MTINMITLVTACFFFPCGVLGAAHGGIQRPIRTHVLCMCKLKCVCEDAHADTAGHVSSVRSLTFQNAQPLIEYFLAVSASMVCLLQACHSVHNKSIPHNYVIILCMERQTIALRGALYDTEVFLYS